MRLIPIPRRITSSQGSFRIGPETAVVARDTPKLAESLRLSLRHHLGIPIAVADEPGQNTISFVLEPDGDWPSSEAYALSITPDRIVIRAGAEAGLFYGAQTIRTLALRTQVPCVEIEDSPRFRWRGFMLDSARHFQSVGHVKRLIERMALLKLNVLHWHLTDDQGWRMEIKRYPRLTRIGAVRTPDEPDGSGSYTQKQIREIVAYAKERNVTVVPEIEIPAHATAAMACYPELTCTGETVPMVGVGLHQFNATGRRIFCAGNEQSFEFIQNVLDEVMSVFDSPVIHLGGDERPDGIWSECPRCRAVMKREDLPTEMALQHWFMDRVTAYVNSKGRQTMAWTTTTEFGIPENQICQDWYWGVIPEATRKGAAVVNSRDRFTYFDYPNFPGRQRPKWMRDLPYERVYEFEPVPEELTTEQTSLVIGSECSMWTEHLEAEDVGEALFPRILAFAEVVWSPASSRNLTEFRGRMAAMEPLLSGLGVRYATPAGLRPVRLAKPGTVRTTMKADGPYIAECAFDGKFARFFWSAEPPKAGDSLTVNLDVPVTVDRIAVYTGSDDAQDDVLRCGELHLTEDGENWETVAAIFGRVTEVWLLPRAVRGVRLVVTEDQENRLAIQEIVLGPPNPRTG